MAAVRHPKGAPALATLIVLMVLSTGCGGEAPSSRDGASTTASQDSAAATNGAPTPAPETAPALTATGVSEALLEQGLPLESIVAYTEETDVNNLMGRPGQYTSKTSFVDTRVPADEAKDGSAGSVELGGGVEVFDEEAQATARGEYIQAVLQGAGGVLGTEYGYVSGGVLLRVSGLLTPDQAATYEDALRELDLGDVSPVTVSTVA